MDEVHEGCKLYCSFCDFTAARREEIKLHQDLIHKHEISSCSRCDFTTSNPKLLKCHEESFHKTVVYKCSQCDFKCNWESSLRQHAEQSHGSKDFSCDVCSFTCRWKTALTKHMRDKHSETASVNQCSFCGVEFPCRRDLKRHIRENHEIPQEFKCSYCGKNFPKKPNLKIHERIHTGEKPYKCETCGHAFTAASNLYHHKKKHANESCASKVAVKQESKGAAVQGIYEQGYLPQHSYRPEDLHLDTVSSHNLSHLDSPGEAHHDHRLDLMETKSESHSYQDPGYLSNFSQYYSGYPQSPAHTNKMQNAMFDPYMDTSPDQYRSVRGKVGFAIIMILFQRRQSSGGDHSNYRRFFTEEQYRMFAQEEDYRKRSIEEQYRKFMSEEHYRKLASEEQYRRLASLASASRNDKGYLWMPALH